MPHDESQRDVGQRKAPFGPALLPEGDRQMMSRLSGFLPFVLGTLVFVGNASPTFGGLGNFLDQSFGSGGRVRTAIGLSATAEAVAIGTDHKIVVAGHWGEATSSSSDRLAIARYLPDGALDASFAGTGIATFPSPGIGASLAIQGDGRIVVCGSSSGGGVLLRYNVDGTLDTTFAGTGVITGVGCSGIAIQADGRIITKAFGQNLVRYNPDGSVDGSFVGAVVSALDFNEIKLQADGKILVAGTTGSAGMQRSTVARFLGDGSLDVSFGAGGLATSAPRSVAYEIEIQSDGKIVVAGHTVTEDLGIVEDLHVVRFNGDGTLDTSFGGTGEVTTPFTGWSSANAVSIQADGKIVAVGTAWPFPPFYSLVSAALSYVLVRYNSDGTLDASFADAGIAFVEIGPDWDHAEASALQYDGKLVVAGFSRYRDPFQDRLSLARFDLEAACPTSPALTCAGPWAKASFVVDERKGWREKLSVKLRKGPTLTANDFGNPLLLGGTEYTMCIYDDSQTLIAEIELERPGAPCRGKACWRAKGLTGYSYKDNDAAADGIKSMSLLGGAAGKSAIVLQALNFAAKDRLGLPHFIAYRLAGSSSVTLQLFRNDAPQCFSASLANVKTTILPVASSAVLVEATN